MNIENQDLLKLAAKALYYRQLYLAFGGESKLQNALMYESKFYAKLPEMENASLCQHGLLYVTK